MLANIARMYSTTLGQSDLTLLEPVPGFLDFDDAGVPTDHLVTYAIEANYSEGVPQDREIGRGLYTSGSLSLTRATVLKSTNSNNKLVLAGDAEVFITPAREDLVTLGLGTYQLKTTAGGITVAILDSLILVNKTVNATTAITLPASANKYGPVIIKDLKGTAESFNITVTPNGSEKIDLASSYVFTSNHECRRFDPLPDGSGYFIAF